jgi:hypothetical protein
MAPLKQQVPAIRTEPVLGSTICQCGHTHDFHVDDGGECAHEATDPGFLQRHPICPCAKFRKRVRQAKE